MSKKHQVVILGFGYGGLGVFEELVKVKDKVDIIVVEPKDYFLFKISALRASVYEDWMDRALVPTNTILQKAHQVIQAKATNIDENKRLIHLDNGQTITYDGLILATGSRNISPADPPSSIVTKDKTQEYWRKFQKELENSKSLLIVGTGAVGLELAGEIFDKYPSMKIRLVTKGNEILQLKAPLRQDGIDSVKQELDKMGIEIIYSEEVEVDRDINFPIVSTNNGVKLKNSGRHIDCDHIVYCIGTELNTSFLPSQWLNLKTKEVLVNPQTLQVQGEQVVYAIGDIAKIDFNKAAYVAKYDSPILVKNLLLSLERKQPEYHASRMVGLMLPLGSKRGRLLTPWFTLGNFISRKVKGEDLFTSKIWKDFVPTKNESSSTRYLFATGFVLLLSALTYAVVTDQTGLFY